jgi:ParB family chromosome partitioning protein
MTHAVKTWKQYFEPQETGKKMFELRKDDRPYKVGDYFLSQEYDSEKNEYTGRETKYIITYILRDAEFLGLKSGYCILQLKTIGY